MPRFSIVDSPTILGLRPTGVERLPEALKNAGLLEGLHAENAGRVDSLPYNPVRDETTLVLNPQAIGEYSRRLAQAVGSLLQSGRFPFVLGGDCSVLIGSLLALRRRGRYGLCFIDGHADFYQPAASPTGEVADMDLAIVTGRGPDVLTDIDGLKPLVRDEDVVVFGYRDTAEASRYGSQDVRDTCMHVFDLERVRALGIVLAASLAVESLTWGHLGGFWLHLDVDVLDDALMPAVDYRLPGGLSFAELSEILRILVSSRRAAGMDLTIFNPSFDPEGMIARELVRCLVRGLV